MAAGSKKGGGDTGSAKKVSYAHIVEEGFEFLTGAFVGQLLAGFAHAGFSGALRGLQGGLFDKLFAGKNRTDEVKPDDVNKARADYKDLLKKVGVDAKVLAMGDEYILSLVNVAAGNASEDQKRKDIEALKQAFRAKFNQYQLDRVKEGWSNVMAELGEIDVEVAAGRKVRSIPVATSPSVSRPLSYVQDLTQWVQELEPDQRVTFLNRRHKITARMLTDILDRDANSGQRYQHLMLVLGESTWREEAHEVVDAVLAGRGDHPAVQRLVRASSDNVADRQFVSAVSEPARRYRRGL